MTYLHGKRGLSGQAYLGGGSVQVWTMSSTCSLSCAWTNEAVKANNATKIFDAVHIFFVTPFLIHFYFQDTSISGGFSWDFQF